MDDLTVGWDALGVHRGDVLMVHASLSAFGVVQDGAQGIVDSIRAAVGRSGTIVVPTFTPQIADPAPEVTGARSLEVRARREAVPVFWSDTPSQMGAVAETLRRSTGTLRSSHPQVSVAAQGPAAAEIIARQSLGYAVGAESPFAAVRRLGGRILLLGVGHNRNTFLHHAESLSILHRHKLRRFPMIIGAERVWVEVPDVADDLDTLFPRIGAEFEELGTSSVSLVGQASCRLLDADSFVRFATPRFGFYLHEQV
ncbi:aminoglycoside 3-N-acetyltransferase [Nakamurella sp. UYEF19]|uniref:aminoglycoside N(3)-acetyltransferase n=1 Tax=Nakamurella sp. UYEF19 TaxID=1756392 RepID=UPI003399FDF9